MSTEQSHLKSTAERSLTLTEAARFAELHADVPQGSSYPTPNTTMLASFGRPLYRRDRSPVEAPVKASVFVDRMAEHWTTTLRNKESQELRSIWFRICCAFNQQVLQHGTIEGDRWRVIAAELGSGKTESLKLYCSMLPSSTDPFAKNPHPGVLIIVRLKQQADDIAKDINSRSGQGTGANGEDCRPSAFAYHSDTKHSVKLEELRHFPVLVVTHAAYECGLEAINSDAPNKDALAKWSHLHSWGLRFRQLTVIDEAIDLIREEHATLANLRQLLACIPDALRCKHHKAVAVIEQTINVLTIYASSLQRRRSKKEREANPVTLPELVNLSPLWHDLKEVKSFPSIIPLGIKDVAGSRDKQVRLLKNNLRETLAGVQSLLNRWHWYFYKLKDHTLTTAWLLIPDEGLSGAVVMDATAESNLMYKLLHDRFDIVTMPSARNYQNVRHYATIAPETGKRKVLKNADAIVKEMVFNLQTFYGEKIKHRSVLFLTHKALKPFVVKHAKNAGFQKIDVAWWNAIDGRNDWSDYNTVVVLSQPHRDPSTAANIFQAIFGPQSSEWLNNPERRRWKECADVLADLERSHLVVSNAQGINRSRSRRVVDEQGNCQPVDIFSRLPRRDAAYMRVGLQRAMRGIKQMAWSSFKPLDGRKVPAPAFDEALVAYGSIMPFDYVRASKVRDELGCGSTQWDSLCAQMKDAESTLHERLALLGVHYVTQREGSRVLAYLHRVEVIHPEPMLYDEDDNDDTAMLDLVEDLDEQSPFTSINTDGPRE